MDSRTGDLCTFHPHPYLHGLDTGYGHERRGEQSIETLVPLGIGADACRQSFEMDRELPADGIPVLCRVINDLLHLSCGVIVRNEDARPVPLSPIKRPCVLHGPYTGHP